MAKQKRTRVNRSPEAVTTNQMGTRLKVENIKWRTEQANAAGLSRSAFIDKLIDSMRETQNGLNQGGIFDMYQPEIDRLIDQVVERRLDQRRAE